MYINLLLKQAVLNLAMEVAYHKTAVQTLTSHL